MKVFLTLLVCIVGLIPAVQSFFLIFFPRTLLRFREETYDRDNYRHYSKRGTFPYFFWNIRALNSKLVRVVDWLTLFVVWGYIPYLLGELMQGVYKVWRQI